MVSKILDISKVISALYNYILNVDIKEMVNKMIFKKYFDISKLTE